MPPPLHVGFDKDGTLTDLHSYWAHTCAIRARTLRQRWPVVSEAELLAVMGIAGGRIKPGGPVGYKPRATIVAAVAAALGRTPEEVAAVFTQVDALQQASNDYKVDALPGALDALRALKARGLKLSVYTSDRAENARRTLAAAGMAELFDAIVGGDGVKNPKPHPEGFETACRLVGVEPARSAYVGDTLDDLHMAREAGALAVGVATGLLGLAELKAAAPDSVASLSELRLS